MNQTDKDDKNVYDNAISSFRNIMYCNISKQAKYSMSATFIGIKSKNRKEWYLTHIANMLIGVTTVAMYDSLTPDAEKFIIN